MRELIKLAPCPVVFDHDVASSNVTRFAQALAKCSDDCVAPFGKLSCKKTIPAVSAAVRACNRPSDSGATEQRDEIAPHESIELHLLPRARNSQASYRIGKGVKPNREEESRLDGYSRLLL